MKPIRAPKPPDPILRGVVMVGIIDGKAAVARLIDEPGAAQAESKAAADTGKYEAVVLCKPYQVRRAS